MLTPRIEIPVGSNSLCPSALAPMQDVTGLPFMTIIGERGEPDMFFTEFFRVHENSRLDPEILTSISHNPTNRPVFAQLIGENIQYIKRTIYDLKQYPIAGIDLNMGCPAPRVYKKKVGGALLKDPNKIDQILGSMRAAWAGNLTVKMRIGFEDDRNFEEILKIILKHQIDMLSIHVRTVTGGYNTRPQYQYVKKAVDLLGEKCPVLVNGSIDSAEDAWGLKQKLGTYGVMIGRAAIRNPWIFRQIREVSQGATPYVPKRADLYFYCHELYEKLKKPGMEEQKMVSRMKKFLNYIGAAIMDNGVFLNQMRRAFVKDELFGVFREHLLDGEKSNMEIYT